MVGGCPHAVHEIIISAVGDDGEQLSVPVLSQGVQLGPVKSLNISTLRQEQWGLKTEFLYEDYIRQPLRVERANESKEVLTGFAREVIRDLELGAIIEEAMLHQDTKVIIKIEASVERFHGLPWEVLENPEVWREASATPGQHVPDIMVCRSVTASSATEEKVDARGVTVPHSSVEEINILLVVARKNGPTSDRPDINYRLNALPLTQLVDEMGPKARLYIARPGTYQSFKSALGDRRYDVVHLDLHGLSVAGVYAKLGFTAPTASRSERGEGLEWISASDVAGHLVRNGVPLVVVNACQSASGGVGVSNLAAVLVGRGVESVVGMTHSVHEDAVRIFVPKFYTSYLIDGQSAVESTYRARRALQRNPLRNAKTFGMEIDLNDYILPAVFQARGRVGLATRCVVEELETAAALAGEKPDPGPERGAPSHADNLKTPFFGRDADMFQVERKLFLRGPTGLIHGWACAGKTTLIDHLADWWRKSGFISEVRRIVVPEGDDVRGLATEQAQLAVPMSSPKSDPSSPVLPSLIVIEHLEDLPRDRYPQLVQYLVDATRHQKAVVIMSSEDLNFHSHAIAAGCPIWNYDLEGSDPRDTLKYLSSCLKPAVSAAAVTGKNSTSSTDLRYLRRILRLFDYNPVAVVELESFLRRTGMSPSQVFWQLQSHPLGMTWSSQSAARLVQVLRGKLPLRPSGSPAGWLPWPTLSGGHFFYHQIRTPDTSSDPNITPPMRDYLTSPQVTRHPRDKGTDVLHPLVVEWIRQVYANQEANRDSSMRNTVTHYFNICRGFSTSKERHTWLSDEEFLNLVACMEFCLNLQASTAEPDAGIILDLLWATCLRAQCVTATAPTQQTLEDQELLADLSTAVVMVRLPRFRPFDSDTWDAYNGACLSEYATKSALSVLDTARLALHCLFLAKFSVSSTATARPWVLASKLLLQEVDLLGSEAGVHTLLRFLKCSAVVLDMELGCKKMTPLKDLVDLSRKLNSIQLPTAEMKFISTWTNDCICRFGGSVVSPTSHGFEERLQCVCEATSGLDEQSPHVVAFSSALDILNASKEDGRGSATQKVMVDRQIQKLEDKLADAISSGEISLETVVLRLLLQVRLHRGEWGTSLLLVDRLESALGASEFLPGLSTDEQVHKRWGIRFERIRAECHHFLGHSEEFEHHAEKLRQLREARESKWTYEHMREEAIANAVSSNVATLQRGFAKHAHGASGPSGLQNQRLLRREKMTREMLDQRLSSPLDKLADPVFSKISDQLESAASATYSLDMAVESPDVDYPSMFLERFQPYAIDLFFACIQRPGGSG
ncbi:CHAT domain-containing protein [Rhypophila decipiens]|uniref:CHAT domain-containing protein n=1 Tax=Rhypophila decipiens TaxID=261697 RepID=A0AAN7B6V5_9PEZI|nr:CHAT domain-containing protein [Rhypophila decipiens]